MYQSVYRLRKSLGLNIDTRERIIIYKYQKDEELMNDPRIVKLCKTYGFARQAEI